MPIIETVLLKLASRCNLDCSYCYVYRMGDQGWRIQPKRMSVETLTVLADRLRDLALGQGRPFAVVFHGGEPLLVGPARFELACAVLRDRLPPGCELGLQTNGVLLTEEIVASCVRHDVGVSVSIDGPAAVHDRHRPQRNGRGSHRAVTDGMALLNATPAGRALFSGVLAVVDLTSDPIEVYEALKATGAPNIDLLYRDGNHDALPPGKASFASSEYGHWMAGLLRHYLSDPNPTPVRVLDDMLRLLLGGAATKEGVGTSDFGILVVETDGSVSKNDTLKSAYASADRFEGTFSALERPLAEIVADPVYGAYQSGHASAPAACRSCPDFRVCGGGMPAHRWRDGTGFENPSVFCSDQKTLIAEMRGLMPPGVMAA